MKWLYEYLCEVHGVFTEWQEPEFRKEGADCPQCHVKAEYKISAPTVKLPGWCDTFPSASLKWEERHIREGRKTPEPQ